MLTVRIAAKTFEAQDVCAFELVSPDGQPLPEFTAGAHIDVHLPNGLIRQYSLCNSPSERHRYLIGVHRAPTSRGGSDYMHAQVQVGDQLAISPPRNLFPLSEDMQAGALLFAGGIGITPLLAMAEHLTRTGQTFSLHYCARSKARAAFFDRIATSGFAGHSSFYFDDAGPEAQLETGRILAQSRPDTHIYVCGPAGFMEHVLETARGLGWAGTHLHREYFTGASIDHSADDAFSVRIASTGEIIDIPAAKTALEVLIDKGFDIPMSCEQGICGTCLTRVLEGVPDHRDQFQTDDELAQNNQFTPCCSRARTPLLVLDL